MAANPPKELSIKHQAIMDYMLQNPAEPGSKVAAHFNVTQSWLSTIIHSDAFQAELARRREDIEVQIAQDIPTRLRGLTHMALANLEAAYDLGVGVTRNTDFEVIKLGMEATGLGKSATPVAAPTAVINLTIDASVLASAREKMVNLIPTPESLPALELEPGNVETLTLSTPEST